MKKYSAVIFDWDGTVMNSTWSIVAAIQGACADMKLAVPNAEQAAWVIGLSLDRALYHCVPDLKAHQYDDFIAHYRKHFFSRDHESRLFDGIVDVFQLLHSRQARLAVATGKSRVGLDRALNQTQLLTTFHTTRCADETAGKPDPTMLIEILDEFGMHPSDVLMVGDTTHDIEMAHNAGVDSLAVSYGAHDPDTLEKSKPLVMVSDVKQMQGWLSERLPA